MSITHGEMYKEKERQELLHVEQHETQMREAQKPQEQQTAQSQEQDLLEKYEEQTGQIDLTAVVNRQEESMPQQVVAASPVHESVRSEEILKGNELADKQQAQIQEQEQQIAQEAQVSGQQEEAQARTDQEEKQDIPEYEALITLQQELQGDHDSASPEFQAVRQKMDLMVSVMNQDMSAQADAMYELRQAAVHYYNTHRGYRWSSKGKRRKDLINRIIDQVQAAIVSDAIPESVQCAILNRIMSDPSPEGFSSKKTVEFARAQAKIKAEEEAGTDQVDEYSFKMYCVMQQSIEDKSTAVQQYDLEKRTKEAEKTGKVLDVRDWGAFMAPYQVDANGEPLTKQDKETRDKANRFFDHMTNGTVTERREILMNEMSRIIDFQCTPEMLSAEYIYAHFKELWDLNYRYGALDNLIHAQANQEAFDGIESEIKMDYEIHAKMLDLYMNVIFSIAEIKNVKRNGGFRCDSEDISMPQLPAFAREYAKRGQIQIDPDQELAWENDRIYKGKNGYVRQMASLDSRASYEDALLDLIDMIQRPREQQERIIKRDAVLRAEKIYRDRLDAEPLEPLEFTDQAQELAKLEQLFTSFDQADLKQYERMSVEELLKRSPDVLMLQDRVQYLTDQMQYYIANGGDLDEATIRRLEAKAAYVKDLTEYVREWTELINNPYYVTMGTELLETASQEDLQALHREQEEGDEKQYYYLLAKIKGGAFEKTVRDYDAAIQYVLSSEKNEKFINLKAVLARHEEERKEDPARAQKLAERRGLYEQAVKEYVESQRKRNRIQEVSMRQNGGIHLVRYVAAQLMFPDMSDEEIKARTKNLTSKKREIRHAEYNRIFDQLINLDLTRLEHLDTDEKLIANTDLVLKCGELGMEVWNMFDVALQDQMEIPTERREEIWKRYKYLISLSNLLKARLNIVENECYGELTGEEEPQSVDQAYQMMNECTKEGKKKMVAWLALVMTTINERMESPIDLNGPLNEQYATYQPPAMKDSLKK